MVAIYHAYYNFSRIHQTLRVTTAMEAGSTNHVWTILELLETVSGNATKQAAA